jgi:hypothetical protein
MRVFQQQLSRFVKRAAAVSAIVVAATTSVGAQPITFTFTGTGTGSLASQAFRITPFTVTINTDVSALTNYPGSPTTLAYLGLGGSIDLGALGVASFTDPLYVFLNPNGPTVGFGTMTNFDLIDIIDPALAGYGLATSFGPITSPGSYMNSQFTNVATSLGGLTFSNIGDPTFQAQVGSTVPEPGTVLLVASGLVAVGVLRRRRTRA